MYSKVIYLYHLMTMHGLSHYLPPKLLRGSQSPITVTRNWLFLVSSKQWFGSWWLVTNCTSWPWDCKAKAASTTSLSAPPIPRSGCKNTTVFFVIIDCWVWQFFLYQNIFLMHVIEKRGHYWKRRNFSDGYRVCMLQITAQ